jgi:Tfp pilus assembly protein PilF
VAFTTLGFVAECAFDRTGPNVHEAEGFYRHAIAEDSGNAQAHANLARIVSDRGDSVNLWRPRFERAIALAPKTAATYEAWGNALLLNGEPGAGIDKLEEALRIDPSSSTVQVHLGYAYLYRGRRGDTAVAIRRLSTAVLRNPDAAVLTKYGELLLKNREWVAAADAYRRAADLDPKNLELRFLLAVALDSGARKYEARELLLDLARQTLDTSAYCSAAKRYVPDLVRCGTTLAMRRPD